MSGRSSPTDGAPPAARRKAPVYWQERPLPVRVLEIADEGHRIELLELEAPVLDEPPAPAPAEVVPAVEVPVELVVVLPELPAKLVPALLP